MNFTTLAELQARIPTLEGNEKISTETIQEVISQKSAFIEGKISKLYEIPNETDNPKSWAMLKDICIEICRPTLDASLAIVIENEEGGQELPMATEAAMKQLEEIRAGELGLPDAARCNKCASVYSNYYETSCVDTGEPDDESQFRY